MTVLELIQTFPHFKLKLSHFWNRDGRLSLDPVYSYSGLARDFPQKMRDYTRLFDHFEITSPAVTNISIDKATHLLRITLEREIRNGE